MGMTRITRPGSLAAIAALALFSAAAAEKPDFTGEWKLNADKSDLGGQPPPDSWVRKIHQKDGKISFATIQQREGQEFRSEFTLTTDGKEGSFQMGGGEAKGSMTWDGPVLVLKTQRESGMGPIIQNERATLAPDGKSVTFDVAINVNGNDIMMKLVFEKK